MELSQEYQEKVYAGVLGKIIGVYLGRPFEQWAHELIVETLGKVDYYVSEKLDKPLIVTDDDITGTFTFLRALHDYHNGLDITAEQIGQTWLNNIVEGETILWWGGVGESTEHTAFHNLKKGLSAPMSGSIETNGKVVSEQIGAQIFIDGWAMVCPGDPEKAVSLAKRAASVSHDGEAIYGAQVIASMESQAFIEKDIETLIETAKKFIPQSSDIFRVINDVQNWHSSEPSWLKTREKIEKNYGYHLYPGNCHIVPNHALIMLALLYGKDNFQESMSIVNTSGWDTDCNAGNLGCILGIKNGLVGLENGPDWRSPINDIIYCPTANGGETMTDALRESYKIINLARKVNNLEAVIPKKGARFHFEMPGSVQGWKVRKNKASGTLSINNVSNFSEQGKRCLEISLISSQSEYHNEIFVSTFMPEEIKNLSGQKKETFFWYNFLCSPIIYPGQKITAFVKGDANNRDEVHFNLFVRVYGQSDKISLICSESYLISPDKSKEITWSPKVPNGNPIFEIGLRFGVRHSRKGKVFLDSVNISGEAKTTFERPSHTPKFERGRAFEPPRAEMWRHSWVQAVDHWTDRHIKGETFKISHNNGRGMITTGSSDWKNYTVSSTIVYYLAVSGGVAVRVQGLERYYAIELTKAGRFRLVKLLDGMKVLCELSYEFEFNVPYTLSLSINGNLLEGTINGDTLISYEDNDCPLENGGIGLVVENGTISTEKIVLQ